MPSGLRVFLYVEAHATRVSCDAMIAEPLRIGVVLRQYLRHILVGGTRYFERKLNRWLLDADYLLEGNSFSFESNH